MGQGDALLPAIYPSVTEYVSVAWRLLLRKEEEALIASEGPARGYEVPHPLLARRHGEDPEVRDGEVPSVKPLPQIHPRYSRSSIGLDSGRRSEFNLIDHDGVWRIHRDRGGGHGRMALYLRHPP